MIVPSLNSKSKFGKFLKRRWGRGPSMSGLKSSVKGHGHTMGAALDNKWTKMALAAGLTATGVGAPAAIALMAGAGGAGKLLKKGGNIGDGLRGAAQGAASGAASAYGGQLLGKVGSKIPGASKVGGLFKGGGDFDLSGAGDAMNAVNRSVHAGGSLGNVASDPGRFRSIGGMAKKAGSFLKNNGDDVIKYARAAGDAYGAYDNAQRRGRYEDMAEAEYARRAPLRDAGMAAMLDDSTPDTAATFADPMAPQGRYRKVRVGSAY